MFCGISHQVPVEVWYALDGDITKSEDAWTIHASYAFTNGTFWMETLRHQCAGLMLEDASCIVFG